MYQNRADYIEDLNSYIISIKERFNNLLHTLNWSKESLASTNKEVSTKQASIDVYNSVSAEQHELQGDRSSSEGAPLRHLYSEIVASLQAPEGPSKTRDSKDARREDKAAALAQLLKIERDAKRRRISYKNKVHTKNKSQVEVLREVIGEQMLTLSGGETNHKAEDMASDNNQISPNQTTKLYALRPFTENPHMAWMSVLEKVEEDKSGLIPQIRTQINKAEDIKSEIIHQNRTQTNKTEHTRLSNEHHRNSKVIDEKRDERKNDHSPSSRKIKKKDNNHKEHSRKQNERYRNGDHSPRREYKHHKKHKKSRSRSHSPQQKISNHHKHKHKKKRH